MCVLKKIIKAAKWLVTHSKLFQNEGILINEQWSLESQYDNSFTHESLNIEGGQNNEIITETDSSHRNVLGIVTLFYILQTLES